MNLAGPSAGDVRVWNTYLYWAWSLQRRPVTGDLEIADPRKRLDERRSTALQAILLAAFALEYRIKRINEELQIVHSAKEPLGVLLSKFQSRVESKGRLDNGHGIVLPREWNRLYDRLVALKDLRNNIAHAKFAELRLMLGQSRSGIDRTSARSYNSVVDFIRVSSQAIGYETRTGSEAREHYRRLRVYS